MSARFRMNEGDWVCTELQCGNVNFARRTSCNRCGKEKVETLKKKKLGTEIGKAAAEKSHGLFSADDWQCSKCGNVNWARRQQCNTCNAPRYGEIEERTGYGGGYNERENVEYVEREESDGEYDEFGRKKKQYRGKKESGEVSTSSEPNPEEAKSEKEPKESKEKTVDLDEDDEEEEEEDDDDDADLSKYDLSGWGDSDDNTEDAKDKNETEKRKSPSSSSSSTCKSESQSPTTKRRKYDSDSRSRSSSSEFRSGS